MKKIILDVDTGTDDAMAIIAAALAKDIDLMALTAVNGNQPLPNTLENTLRVVDLLGMDIPVYAGCPHPMVMTLDPNRPHKQGMEPIEQVIDGKVVNIHDEYLPLPPSRTKPKEQHAVSFLIDTLRHADAPVTIVAVGPATNIAMALRMAPDIAQHIEEIVVMGGGVRTGNITKAAEFNFFVDPEAAQIMLQAPVKISIFPLDATTSILFSKEDGRKLAAIGSAPAAFFGGLIEEFTARMELLGISNTDDPSDHRCAIHDALCILYLIDPSIVTSMKHQDCCVDFGGGEADGQLLAEQRSYMKPKSNIQIAYQLNKEKVMDLLLSILSGQN